MRQFARRGLLACAVVALVGCPPQRRVSPRLPLLRDDDRQPFRPRPAKASSGLVWDGADQMFFGPLARTLALASSEEARNVNALDEVPDSSWFEGRAGARDHAPDAMRQGPCGAPVPDGLRWQVTAGKPDGDNPGFVARIADGRRFVVKFDSMGHPRATAADAIVSRLFHAIGYQVPCNRIVHLARSELVVAARATFTDPRGDKHPLTAEVLDSIVRRAQRRSDGLLRASASELLEGEPLGPFRFEGVRPDDPNDVVPHEHRRELRALRLAAAWVGHTDSREANTLDTWRARPDGSGHVEHHLIDFGDCLGSVWEPPMLGRRVGLSAYVDLPDVLVDWLAFGLVARRWETLRFGPFGAVLGYFDDPGFDPERWHPGYDNPAMEAMTDRDAAWMARILARLDASHLAAAVEVGRLEDRRLAERIVALLEERRRRIVKAYLTRVSPLTAPRLTVGDDSAPRTVCVEDRATTSGAFPGRVPRYAVRSPDGDGWTALTADPSGIVCATLPRGSGLLALEFAVAPPPSGALTVVVATLRGRPEIVAVVRDASVAPRWDAAPELP